MVWHEIFPTHEVEVYSILRKLCRITQCGNTVPQHQCGKQARAEWSDCARWILPTFTKSCQLQVTLPKYGKISAHFFSLNDLRNNGPNINCVTQTYLGKILNSKVGGSGPCSPPGFRHLWMQRLMMRSVTWNRFPIKNLWLIPCLCHLWRKVTWAF